MFEPAYADGAVTLYQGECVAVLHTLEANSIDVVLTDPPYLLNFMNKTFDTQHKILPGANEGQRMQAWHMAWAIEVLRVLKPGGYCLAMGGTRTFHRLMCALEDAGFEIRDTLMYLYGSGFPKSADVSKMIDKEAGAVREVLGPSPFASRRPNPRLPGSSVFNDDNYVEEAGGIPLTAPATDAAREWTGWGSALKPSWENIVMARKPLNGALVHSVQKWGTGALHIDACRVPGTEPHHNYGRTSGEGAWAGASETPFPTPPQGRWPANTLTDGSAEVRAMFPQVQAGGSVNASDTRSNAIYGQDPTRPAFVAYNDTGSAARFFAVCPQDDPPQRFLYTSKVSPDERGSSTHPTQKPLSLMTWLLQLVTRPGALVLDPFLGSGTTAVACHRLRRRCLGIEREAEYMAIAKARMEQEWHQEQQTLF